MDSLSDRITAISPVFEQKGWVYRQLGIEPVINCGGVRSTFGGSNPLPDVLDAMNAAAEAFVDLDELAEAAGRRLSALTGAEWGIVTSCSTAGMALATAACAVGHDPELMAQLPDTRGLPNKVVIPEGQRFAYDFVFRLVGMQVVTVSTPEELRTTLDGSVALICVLGRATDQSDLNLGDIVTVARKKGVPVLVDAAAQTPARPDPWLAQGADLVVYAGGKFVRGPQSTGYLLGREDLCRAAWLNGPPHQAFGRGMKLGKEEIVGALVALEFFLDRRDPNAEEQSMLDRLRSVSSAFEDASWAETKIVNSSAGWMAPRLRIAWDRTVIHVTSDDVRVAMSEARPRIHIHDFWSTATSILIDPFNLRDDEAPLVGQALRAFLDNAAGFQEPGDPEPIEDVTGSWDTVVSLLTGDARHKLTLSMTDGSISGQHETRHSSGTITGSIQNRKVRLQARHPAEPAAIYYTFEGIVDGAVMTGKVTLGAATKEHFGAVFLGQFGEVPWRAERSRGEAGSRQTSTTEAIA